MTPPEEKSITVGESRCRVWEKGDGPTVGFLGGFRGTPHWTPFLDHLARRHRVVVPALPGFPGAEPGHRILDDTADWIAMILDLLEASGLAGATIVSESVGAMLALEAAAIAPASVERLVAIGALGLSDPDESIRNPFQTETAEIPKLLCHDLRAYENAFASRAFATRDVAEHEILLYRADEAAARLIWPFADRGVRKRLHRVQAPTLLLRGEHDAIVPHGCLERLAAAIPGEARIETIAGAGHLATIDAPERVASAIISFLQRRDAEPQR